LNENEKLDPEIAELLGIQEDNKDISIDSTLPPISAPVSTPSSASKLSAGSGISNGSGINKINLHRVLTDKDHYSKIISKTGEEGARFNELLSKFLKTTEKDEKSMYRERLIPAYWNMISLLIDNLFYEPADERLSLYRYGLLNITFIDEEQRNILININNNDVFDDGYFVDEWLTEVGNGNISPSSVDETKKGKKSAPSAVKAKIERKSGSKEAELVNMKQKIEHHLLYEKSLKSCVEIIVKHNMAPGLEGIIAPYSPEQKKALAQMQDIGKTLVKSDRDLNNALRTLLSLDNEIKTLESSGLHETLDVDSKVVSEEFITIRQMIKMTVGRQGNHFPFLIKYFMPKSEMEICTKNNLKNLLNEIEKIDPGIFKRKYKQEEHRIVPRFIIVPSYGSFGICWEPFERMNKATGKGRISIPMFPRELKTSVLYALGDLRWQVAKEKALHYWMEEGLTGHYYEYSQNTKLKGDLKQAFIQDYILWIKFESQGMQKLNKDVRNIFWRYIPFPQELKDALKNRGYYYSELYKKDQTRSMSRGY
jgi:hypothetical protein